VTLEGLPVIACFWFKDLPIRAERKRQPDLAGEPFVVASSDGAILAVSGESARFGIRPGQTATSARALCRGLIVLPYDRSEYDRAAEPFWDALAAESSVVEPASPELCYMEIAGADVVSRMRNLSVAVSEAAQMPVRVGIGRTKLIARRAALAPIKAEPLAYVAAGDESRFLSKAKLAGSIPLEPKLIHELARLGVETFGDLRQIPKAEIARRFKHVSYKLSRLGVGQDDDPVRPIWPPPRTECGYAFEEETSMTGPINSALAQCAGMIAADLLATTRYCRSLSLTVQLEDHSYLREVESLNLPARDEASLLRAALRLLRRLNLDQAILDVCLTAGDLDIGSGVQLALLDDNQSARNYPHERKNNLEATLRYLRRKHGYSIVMPASLLVHARRVGFWTHYLAKLRNELVSVATDAKGEPVRYTRQPRRGRHAAYSIKQVVDRWHEASWKWGKVIDTQAYRVITQPDGTYELCKLSESEWVLRGIGD
jgi:nucleotidyltransferase/DNA polymerase involved in DNA repair